MRMIEMPGWNKGFAAYDSGFFAQKPPVVKFGTGRDVGDKTPRWIYFAHELGHHYCGHKTRPEGFNAEIRLALMEIEAWEWAIGRQKKEEVRREMLGAARECLVTYGIKNWTPEWAKDGE